MILIDDHKMLRKGISSYITENTDWTILAEAESLEEIPGIIKKSRPIKATKSSPSLTYK